MQIAPLFEPHLNCGSTAANEIPLFHCCSTALYYGGIIGSVDSHVDLSYEHGTSPFPE